MYQKLYLIITVLIINVSAPAQTPLPYYTGFDEGISTPGWQEFRKGVTINWGWLGSEDYISPPGSLYHIFPDASTASTDTTMDWFVSPAFDFSGGAIIDSLYAGIYSVGGPPHPEDFIGLYLLNGSQDPSLAITVTLLADFTLFPNGVGGGWNDTTNILIPPTEGASYIAFKYIATNNNFQAGFDDLYISALSTGIQSVTADAELNVYPNPADNHLTIDLDSNHKKVQVTITDITGKVVYTAVATDTQEVDVNTNDFVEGIYVVLIQATDFIAAKKLVVEK
jgi:hypothetical protein